MAPASFMRPSLLEGAYAALSNAAWQEIRVRSGRDDNSVVKRSCREKTPISKYLVIPAGARCAEWRDLRFF
jgi:hypothetical protein